MTVVERERLLLFLLEAVRPVIATFVRSGLDFDELCQDASVWILELIDRDVDGKRANPVYAKLHIKHRIISKMRYLKYRSMLSLDEPLSKDSEVTLIDLLPSPYSHDPASLLITRERLVQLEAEIRSMQGNHGVAVRDRYETALATYC